jgi:hypothetical protein
VHHASVRPESFRLAQAGLPFLCNTDRLREDVLGGDRQKHFKQIFRDHWEAFKARYPRFDTPDYDTVVQKMLDCGDPEKMATSNTAASIALKLTGLPSPVSLPSACPVPNRG